MQRSDIIFSRHQLQGVIGFGDAERASSSAVSPYSERMTASLDRLQRDSSDGFSCRGTPSVDDLELLSTPPLQRSQRACEIIRVRGYSPVVCTIICFAKYQGRYEAVYSICLELIAYGGLAMWSFRLAL